MIGRDLIRNPALAELIKIEEAGVENAQVCEGTENGNKETSPEQAEKTVPESRNTEDNLMPRIRAFHDEIFEYYRETMSGDRNLLFRMKDLWSYMLEEVPDREKLAKKIRNPSMCRNIWRRWMRRLRDGSGRFKKGENDAAADQTKSFFHGPIHMTCMMRRKNRNIL